MTDTALLAVLVAAIAGVLAGRAWAAALRASDASGPLAPPSPHYLRALHQLARGDHEMALSELQKLGREGAEAPGLLQLTGDLLRETGHVERAIQAHQELLDRPVLSRPERAQAQAALAEDFRRAGFLDRAAHAYEQLLRLDPRNIEALSGTQRLHEDQRQWRDAYDAQTRLSRLRKSDDSLVLGYLQAEMGAEAAAAGLTENAERAFRTALSLDRRVFPAHLGLADLLAGPDPAQAVRVLEEAVQLVPERAYLAFDRLARLYAGLGEPSRFAQLCDRMVAADPRDWRARLALARLLREEGRLEDAWGLLLRALESNPQVLLLHLEAWRTLRALGQGGPLVDDYLAHAEAAVYYRDPHVCTACRYRAEEMLWRCPHCHRWNTFVEERLAALPR